jgi:hypothetical protein
MNELIETVNELKQLALELNISGQTNEQRMMLAIINAFDTFSKTLSDIQSSDREELLSICPTCGEAIRMSISEENPTCPYCHEDIAVVTMMFSK